MTTYRLWPATNGGALVGAGSGNFINGVTFEVVPGVKWFDGYWIWVSSGGDTGPRKCALWVESSNSTGQVVAGSVVTSGTLSATPAGGESGGHWNFVPLPTSIPLAPGTAYIAAVGWVVVAGFADTSGYWGAGAGTNGIVNGPLIAFSSATSGGTSNKAPYAGGQGVFTTAGADPSVTEPLSQSGSDNFWVDVQVNDSPAGSYAGSYRLWPNNTAANEVTVTDAAVNYDVATEFALSAPCTLNKVWYFSPSSATQLATAANIWSITAPGTSGTLAAANSSPSWSGAAGSGWVSCSFTGVTLPAGKYKVSVYNGAGSPAGWNAKDANSDYWRNGPAASGITSGPLSAPNLASASTAFNYNGNAGGTPPFSDGTTLAGQPTFTQGPPDSYPYLVALVTTPTAGSTQNYWVDVEVTPVPVVVAPFAATPGRTWLRRFHHRQLRPAAPAARTESGLLAITLPAAATSLTGTVTHKGSFAVTLPRPVTSLSGTVTHQGSFAAVLPAPHTSLSGTVAHLGSFAVTLPKPVLSLTGQVGSGESGSLALTLPAPHTSLAGVITHQGSLAVTVPAARVSLTGAVGHTGTLAARLPAPVFSVTAPPPPFTVGTLTAITAAASTITASDQRTGGPS